MTRTTKSTETFRFTTHLVDGAGDAYARAHRAIPADLDRAMREVGVIGWEIRRNGETLTHTVEAVDRIRMENALAADPANVAWQVEVAPYLTTKHAAADDNLAGDERGELIWSFSWPTR